MRPQSASNPWMIAAGVGVFVSALWSTREIELFQSSSILASLYIVFATVLAIGLIDIVFMRVHERASTGLDFRIAHFSFGRSFTKFLGWMLSVMGLGVLYWLFPEYRGTFYVTWWAMIRFIWPYFLILAFAYIAFVDRHMKKPEDTYYLLGRLALNPFNRTRWKIPDLGQHALGWLVKGFFLPLMFTYLVRDITKFKDFDFAHLDSFSHSYNFLYDTLFLIDVGWVSMGYIFSLRLIDTHLRSSEPTMLGWAAALTCYEPFWSLIGAHYLAYNSGRNWEAWVSEPWLQYLWGGGILFLVVVYVWASVMFGARFSNLTHRGIITNGAYAWTKHPAYVAKNISWWMLSMPFLAEYSIRCSILLLLLNAVYFLRARTEERHLSRDPAYVEYARYMNEHSIFAPLAKLKGFGWLRYRVIST